MIEVYPYTNTYLAREALMQLVAAARAGQHSARMKLEAQRETARDDVFEYRVRKMLWDISRHPATRELHGKALAYYRRLHEQKRPEGVSPEEWQRQCITENKVLRYLRDIMRKMNPPRFTDELRVVRTRSGLEYRAHGPKSRKLLKAKSKTVFTNVELLASGLPDDAENFKHLFLRRGRELAQQCTPLGEIAPSAEIIEFLCRTKFVSAQRVIAFTEAQARDMAQVLMKRYAMLNWQQGGGKTVAGLYYISFMQQCRGVENVLILSTPKAIKQAWVAHLEEFEIPYVLVESMADLARVRSGDVVLLRFNRLGGKNMRRHVRKQIRGLFKTRKCALLVDESHNLGNYATKRTRNVLALFRRMRYKLLLTGTATRNNVVELYPQIELLYNNSETMTCDAPYRYSIEDDEVTEEANEILGKPFPAFHGMRFWKSCFSPGRTSVFGQQLHGQDIYNADALANLLSYTVLTRSFDEIVGPERYEYHTHVFAQNPWERALYAEIMNDFHRMIARYFKSAGYRRDAYLRLIRQINLLIRAASMPHKFAEWRGAGLPTKMQMILAHMERRRERTLLGVLKHESLHEYERELRRVFPERPLYVVSGKILIERRIDLIAEFQNSQDGILLATQGSLNESVNISRCNHVLVESLPWNIAALEQFVFRCIRFDSTAKTHVHSFYYRETIEPNLMALLLAKERINTFVRRRAFAEGEELFAKYGVEATVLDYLIGKEYDSEGRMRLRWGKQKVVSG